MGSRRVGAAPAGPPRRRLPAPAQRVERHRHAADGRARGAPAEVAPAAARPARRPRRRPLGELLDARGQGVADRDHRSAAGRRRGRAGGGRRARPPPGDAHRRAAPGAVRRRRHRAGRVGRAAGRRSRLRRAGAARPAARTSACCRWSTSWPSARPCTWSGARPRSPSHGRWPRSASRCGRRWPRSGERPATASPRCCRPARSPPACRCWRSLVSIRRAPPADRSTSKPPPASEPRRSAARSLAFLGRLESGELTLDAAPEPVAAAV